MWAPGDLSNTALSPCELQGKVKAAAWCVSSGKGPARVSAINKSIIKGGCPLAFEHTPGEAGVSCSKENEWGEQRREAAKGQEVQKDEVQLKGEGGSGGGG